MSVALQYDEIYTYRDFESWDVSEQYELIDGVAYAMSAPTIRHQALSRELLGLFWQFLQGKPCQVFAAPFGVRLFPRGDKLDTMVFQPDITVICDPEKLSDGRACRGAPDLIIEILSPSTLLMDRTVKLEKYRQAGVREYWIVDPDSLAVIVYTLNDGAYDFRLCQGQVPVAVLPGLTIDFEALRSNL